MVEAFNINDLIYKMNAGKESDTSAVNSGTYKDVLDKIRHVISRNHSSELINVMYSEDAREKLKYLIVRYLNQNKLSVAECKNISDEELKNLEIYSIENDDAQNLEEASGDENAEQIASSITLIVNQAQAEKLVLAEYSGKIHMVFVKRGAVG